MSNLVVFIVLLVHGIGHLQGVVVALGLKDFGKWHSRSRLLEKWLSPASQRTVCFTLFMITAIIALVFALCFQGLVLTNISWKLPGFLTATLSFISMALYPKAFAMFFNHIGAVSVNLIIYYAIFISDEWLVNLS